jgi:hypothetical protein
MATSQASHSQVTLDRSKGEGGASAVVRLPQSRQTTASRVVTRRRW